MNILTQARMSFITNCLATRGCFSRIAFMTQFHIDTTQASKDIGLYMKLFPGSMVYLSKVKTYFAPGREPQPSELLDREELAI